MQQQQPPPVTSPAVNHIFPGWGYITMQVCTFVDVPPLSLYAPSPCNDRIPELRGTAGRTAARNSSLSSCSMTCRERERSTGRRWWWWCGHQLYHHDMRCDLSGWAGGTEQHRARIENADRSSRSVSSSKKRKKKKGKRRGCSCVARTPSRRGGRRPSCHFHEEALTQIHRRPPGARL